MMQMYIGLTGNRFQDVFSAVEKMLAKHLLLEAAAAVARIAHFVPFDSLHMSSAEKVNSSEVSTVRPFDQILLTSFKFS